MPVPPDWRDQILDAGAEVLTVPGAVVVRFSRDVAEVVSRPYLANHYLSYTELRRVAVRRATQLLNQDIQGRGYTEGWGYYVVTRSAYPAGGHLVAWLGMQVILAERRLSEGAGE